MKKYSIGIDFGTLSGRALLVDVTTGKECATAVYDYPHGVMSDTFLDGRRLPPDYALQHPRDYIEVLEHTIPAVLREGGATADEIVGIGIDFTSCTVLPTAKDGTPLCFDARFQNEPHAYVKLWKHHAAQEYADKLTALCAGTPLLARYGGKVSSEYIFPKIAQTAEEAPAVFDAAAHFVEAGEYLVTYMTGASCRSAGMAGFKGMWSDADGYPSDAILTALSPRLHGIVGTKISGEIGYAGECAGVLTEAFAKTVGLCAGIPVSVPCIDAHAALPATGITDTGRMLLILGTSACHIFMSEKEAPVPGICGIVKGGLLKEYYCYEAGQACFGDHFDWFIGNCVPASYTEEAKARGVGIHKLLREKASALRIGEGGLVALDFFNGNRSVLMDSDLSGVIVGLTLNTKCEEIYRALLEAVAFGTRTILDNFVKHGIPVGKLLAAGGIAEKDPLLMQILADVTDREIGISGSAQAGALGSAMFGAVAGGAFPTMQDAARVMAKVSDVVYRPIPENVAAYDALYAEYIALHDYFGRGGNDVMKRLKAIKANA
ncbi:MAG: ribulokinase [Clostridia bacterium]|nr:ribulokinase [Clostridia bacterium]